MLETDLFKQLSTVPEFCRSCEFVETCGGGCAGRRRLRGKLDEPDEFCPFYRGDVIDLQCREVRGRDLPESRQRLHRHRRRKTLSLGSGAGTRDGRCGLHLISYRRRAGGPRGDEVVVFDNLDPRVHPASGAAIPAEARFFEGDILSGRGGEGTQTRLRIGLHRGPA